MLFPKALFLATNFPKNRQNSIFLLNFHQKISKFPQPIVLFVQTRENVTQSLEIHLQNRLKYCIFQFSYGIFCNFYKILQRRELRPGRPTSPARALNPPQFFPAYATALTGITENVLIIRKMAIVMSV